jgi:type IV pilus assembly protein PilN
MIRVNLSSTRKGRRIDSSHRQLLAMGGAMLCALGAVAVLHIHGTSTLSELEAGNKKISDDVARLKAELGDYDKVKAQREELIKQRKSIEQLQAGRTGPVFVLRELSEILTPGKGPTFDRILYEEAIRRDPNVGFNASWDTRRAWLEAYEESNKKVKIRGAAKSHDDAAEFMKRLGSSVFFNNVKFDGSSQSNATASVRHVTFNVSAEVAY